MTAWKHASEAGTAIQWPMPHSSSPSSAVEASTAAVARRSLRLGVLASGEGSNFEALVQSCRSGALAAEVAQLVVNNPGCGAIRRAQRLGIGCSVIEHRLLRRREELDAAVVACLSQHRVDVVVMAGWMRIVTPVLIQAFPGRMVNIHPSLLPSFRGLDAVGQALAAGVTLSGCTAHLVVEIGRAHV